MSQSPPFNTAKPRVHRKRRDSAAPAVGLSITAVAVGGFDTQLIVTFSGPVVWNGIDIPHEFKAFTGDGYMDGPAWVLASGPDWIELDFNAGVLPGAAWELVGPMDGITPDVSFPQEGTVTS